MGQSDRSSATVKKTRETSLAADLTVPKEGQRGRWSSSHPAFGDLGPGKATKWESHSHSHSDKQASSATLS